MKNFRGTLTFKVLRQRAPKSGDTGGDEDIIISHLIKPKMHIEYKELTCDANCDGDMIDDDTGKSIPFCKEEFKLKVVNGM